MRLNISLPGVVCVFLPHSRIIVELSTELYPLPSHRPTTRLRVQRQTEDTVIHRDVWMLESYQKA